VNSEREIQKVIRARSFSAQSSFYHHEIQLSDQIHRLPFAYSSSPICLFYALLPERERESKRERKKERSEVKEEDKNEEPFQLKIRKKEQTRESF
jgi:hypothetical protein